MREVLHELVAPPPDQPVPQDWSPLTGKRWEVSTVATPVQWVPEKPTRIDSPRSLGFGIAVNLYAAARYAA